MITVKPHLASVEEAGISLGNGKPIFFFTAAKLLMVAEHGYLFSARTG